MGRLTADEIRLRGLLLAKHRDLLQLHRDLVMSGMVTEDEFWETRKGLLESHDMVMKQKRPPSTSQLIGLDIKPQTDIQGDLKFVLTPALIKSIFEQHPVVQRAFREKVPSVVDEKTFWMQYFTSRFFKEGLNSATTVIPDKPGSNSNNILDEYYRESQREEEEGGLLLKPTEKLPISIDILATTEDHFQAADPEAKQDEKSERTKMATIRKMNKLSSDVVESSGIGRLDGSAVEDALAELCRENEDFHKEISLNLKLDSRQKNAFIPEEKLLMLKSDYKNATSQTVPVPVLSYQDYSALMKDHRPSKTSEESEKFNIDDLTVVDRPAFEAYTSSLVELLRQFWSCYPPGTNKERREKVARMTDVLEKMMAKLSSWIDSSASEQEKTFLQKSTNALVKSAEFAIQSGKPKPSKVESDPKRPKISS